MTIRNQSTLMLLAALASTTLAIEFQQNLRQGYDFYNQSLVMAPRYSQGPKSTQQKVMQDLFEVRCVLARNDVGVRKFERLGEEIVLLAGEAVERVTIEEGGIQHTVRPYAGQKTGMYLDQRPARQRVRELAQGAKVLDLCCYQGGFSVSALAGGAESVTAVDQSETALELATEICQLNGHSALETIQGNVFDVVRDLRVHFLEQQQQQYAVGCCLDCWPVPAVCLTSLIG